MNTEEIWKPVAGWEGYYEVSNLARVRRVDMRRGVRFMRPISGTKKAHGYICVTLTRDSKSTQYYMHRLVGMAFVDNPDGKPQINHIDGDKTNNLPANIEWTDQRENLIHRSQCLGYEVGETHHAARLTEKAVRIIRSIPLALASNQRLAERFGVSRGAIKHVRKGNTWAHVT